MFDKKFNCESLHYFDMKQVLSEKDILNFLIKIEKKEITIKALKEPTEVYAGDVVYLASNGWEFTIFNDANTWDYIDNIKIDETTKVEFEELDNMLGVRSYCPPLDVIIKIYNIPEKR